MTRISQRFLHRDIEERLYELLWDYFAELKSQSSVREFLECLLTDTEKIMIAKRLAIAVLLSRGYTFDVIDDKLKVSKGTITSINRQMELGAVGYKKAIGFIEHKKQKEHVADFLDELLLKVTMPAAKGSFLHGLKSEAGKDLYKRKKQRSVI